jgi:hypothetical protein
MDLLAHEFLANVFQLCTADRACALFFTDVKILFSMSAVPVFFLIGLLFLPRFRCRGILLTIGGFTFLRKFDFFRRRRLEFFLCFIEKADLAGKIIGFLTLFSKELLFPELDLFFKSGDLSVFLRLIRLKTFDGTVFFSHSGLRFFERLCQRFDLLIQFCYGILQLSKADIMSGRIHAKFPPVMLYLL